MLIKPDPIKVKITTTSNKNDVTYNFFGVIMFGFAITFGAGLAFVLLWSMINVIYMIFK